MSALLWKVIWNYKIIICAFGISTCTFIGRLYCGRNRRIKPNINWHRLGAVTPILMDALAAANTRLVRVIKEIFLRRILVVGIFCRSGTLVFASFSQRIFIGMHSWTSSLPSICSNHILSRSSGNFSSGSWSSVARISVAIQPQFPSETYLEYPTEHPSPQVGRDYYVFPEREGTEQ